MGRAIGYLRYNLTNSWSMPDAAATLFCTQDKIEYVLLQDILCSVEIH